MEAKTSSFQGQRGGRSSGINHLKEAIARREKSQYKRVQANKLIYMDSMQESLNKEIQQSVFPYWRNHPSLKGKSFSTCLPPTVLHNGHFEMFRLVCHELPGNRDEPIA